MSLSLRRRARKNWVKYDHWFYYDADSATYDSHDDVAMVNTDEDIGWLMEEDEYWETAWMAFRCNSDAFRIWSSSKKSWGNRFTLNRYDTDDKAFFWTRDRLCARKSSLPHRSF